MSGNFTKKPGYVATGFKSQITDHETVINLMQKREKIKIHVTTFLNHYNLIMPFTAAKITVLDCYNFSPVFQ